jgi:radical SAM protein with 4Fe4S-binding SPASM domain
MKTFQQENDKLLNSFLERTFFDSWKGNSQNFSSIELQMGTACNLKCKYCYYTRYGDQLYPKEIQNPKEIIGNLSLIMDWLIENRYCPKIEFFSGDPLSQQLGLDCIRLIADKVSSAKLKIPSIVIPTNYTFLISENQTKKVKELLKYVEKSGLKPILSASIDGKYCEANRPLRAGKDIRNDAYYQKCFAFNKEYCFGFHPMIYSELIENWPENFLWFQENFKKYGIPYHSIYFLEVRNAEWSDRQIGKFVDLIDFLIEWTFENPCRKNPEEFMNFLFNYRGYNILMNAFITVGRGLGCSLQQTLNVRLGDLAIVPCHRTSYPQYIGGNFAVENGKIQGIKSKNPEIMMAELTFEGKTWPVCESCLLNNLCIRGCLGSQFETTGDLFSPIPTVCKLAHAKIYATIRALKRLGLYENFYEKFEQSKKNSLNNFEKLTQLL